MVQMPKATFVSLLITFFVIGGALGAALLNSSSIFRMTTPAFAQSLIEWENNTQRLANQICDKDAFGALRVCQDYLQHLASARKVSQCFVSTAALAKVNADSSDLVGGVDDNDLCPMRPPNKSLDDIERDCRGIWNHGVAPNYCALVVQSL